MAPPGAPLQPAWAGGMTRASPSANRIGAQSADRAPQARPAVAQPMAFVTPDRVVAVAQAIVGVQRDNGDRTNRPHARMKYLIHDRGLDWFQEQVQERLSFKLQGALPLFWKPVDDHLGWHPGADGTGYYGLYVENGRIKDEGEFRLRSALRKLVKELAPTLHLTPQQNLLVVGLTPADRDRLEELLHAHGVPLPSEISNTLRSSMACPAMPTCGLAVAESERVLPSLIRQLEAVVESVGLAGERISWRMTGCPNGCARPYLGDVGFVGTTLGKYDLYLGGDYDGTRLNQLYAANLPAAEIPELMRPLLAAFAEERHPLEGFGNWCHRLGLEAVRERFLAAEAQSA